jgi:F-type H+-transporting ATPase subunit c
MDIAAGLAAFGVLGPAIALGILTGMSVSAIGRNPEAAPQIRATFIIGAAFAEGLGVLAIVVGILAILLGGGAG